jgi:dihydrofolate reductase
MGRKTYEELLGFGIDWPYTGIPTYIVTANAEFKWITPDTFTLDGNIAEKVRQIQSQQEKNLWLVGGGRVVQYFLDHGLIDRMIISVVPLILGEGIPLFPGKTKETEFNLVDTTTYSTGIVNLTFDVREHF